ncbi:MAG: efflux RND transporter periplasmic adaptor subunit [Bacteroidetes bacterium]|nr:efflux RND transporter periplasmic adaptor subunit [Bacteroidota bacterium]MBS1975935.1 efflux RND transporter periplasmic adaptor subunit [Bacteroidota bacterium]
MRKAFWSALFLLAAAGCSKKEAAVLPPAKVTVVKAVEKDVPLYEDFIAQVYGQSDVEIRSRVEGWVTGVHFQEGSAVKKGQLLYTIDDIQYKANVDRQASELARASAEMVRAQNELSRVKPLTEANALSKKDLDNAIASYDAAKAQVKAYEASLENAKIEYGYTRVYAPFDGVIGISNARVGDYVKGAGNTSVLSTMSSISSVRVRFQLSEREYLRVAKMSSEELKNIRKVQLILADDSLYPETGEVNFADRQIDPKTGTLTIEASFPNTNGLLRPGLFVRVRVLMATVKNAVLIPQRSVFQLQSLYQVFTITDSSTLKVSVVKMGAKSGDGWIVTEGLKAGDKVAIVGNAGLSAKSKIEEIVQEWPENSTEKK